MKAYNRCLVPFSTFVIVLINWTPASRPSDFVNYSTYNYRLNWTPLGPITITIYNRYNFLKCDWCISCFIFHLSFCTVVIGQLAVIGQASKQTLKLFFTRIRHLSIGKHVRKKSAYTLFKNKNEKKNDKIPNWTDSHRLTGSVFVVGLKTSLTV